MLLVSAFYVAGHLFLPHVPLSLSKILVFTLDIGHNMLCLLPSGLHKYKQYRLAGLPRYRKQMKIIIRLHGPLISNDRYLTVLILFFS